MTKEFKNQPSQVPQTGSGSRIACPRAIANEESRAMGVQCDSMAAPPGLLLGLCLVLAIVVAEAKFGCVVADKADRSAYPSTQQRDGGDALDSSVASRRECGSFVFAICSGLVLNLRRELSAFES
jgi:hypothetical protein